MIYGRAEEKRVEGNGRGKEGMGTEERRRQELVKEEEAINEIKIVRDTAS